MGLNKEMILNELGSVMNKLQSADCGCMGKMFSGDQPANPGQQAQQGGGSVGFPLPTCGGCRRGCCHGHGYDSHNYNTQQYAGEPYSPTRPCMGMHCNPRTLYADTYNYLNSHLMQPAVRGVYDDLKSINHNNTVMNNPMASQMGLKSQGGGAAMQGMNQNSGGDMGGMQDPNMSMKQKMTNQPMGNAQMEYAQMGNAQMSGAPMGNAQMGNPTMRQRGGGMGETIMNMMTSDKGSRGIPQVTGAMPNATPQGQNSGGQYDAQMSNLANGDQVQYMQQPNMSNLNAQNEMAYTQQNATGYTQQNPMGGNMPQNAMGGNLPQNAMGGNMPQNAMGGNMPQNAMGGNMPQNAMGGNMPQNAMGGNLQQESGASYKVNYSNPAAQQMNAKRPQTNYGQHTGGMTKFNEMFPGVAGGDLGFDPMAIALQMNPANQQKAAMNTMQQLMEGKMNRTGADAMNQPQTNQQNIPPSMQPIQPAATQQQIPQQQQQAYSVTGTPTMNQSQPQTYTNVLPNQSYQQIPQQQIPHQERQVYSANGAPIMSQGQPQTDTNVVPNQSYQQIPQQQNIPQQQQQIYSATGGPTMNQNLPQNNTNVVPNQYYQQIPQQQQIPPQQQQVYAATGAPIVYQSQPPSEQLYETGMDANVVANQPHQDYSAPTPTSVEERIMEPIFPADTSAYRRRMNEKPRDSKYNTLGQPVKYLPAHLFHTEPDDRSQPLYPVTKTGTRFGVKNTVSKTTIMGNRPVGRVPSRSQLQNIYNQYKGSQSHTQQNVVSPVHNASHSDGKINVSANQPRQGQPMHLEGVAGDTIVNNQTMTTPVKGQPMTPIDDVADNKPHGDVIPAPNMPMKKCRNGLQDVVYTSYPTSAAWSFHGEPGGRYPGFRGH